jgi:hypothetical protein
MDAPPLLRTPHGESRMTFPYTETLSAMMKSL